jgi:5-methylcytosine-specific restriction protein A
MTEHLRHPKNVNHPEWSRAQRGPSGRGLCRICVAEVPSGRRTFCGDACVETYHIRVGRYRDSVYRRDRGVCAICSDDTERKIDTARRTARLLTRPNGHWYEIYSRICRQWGYPTYNSPWQADHIVPLSEGGRNEIQNLRTLCLPCHLDETAKLTGRLAQRRREQPA